MVEHYVADAQHPRRLQAFNQWDQVSVISHRLIRMQDWALPSLWSGRALECKVYVYEAEISAMAPEQHIEGTGAAMLRLRCGHGQNAAASPGLGQPSRHRIFQHARPLWAEPPSGDDQQAAPAALIGGLDKFDQLAMRFGLRQPMQVEPGFNRMQPALQPLGVGAVDAGEPLDRVRIGFGRDRAALSMRTRWFARR